MTVNLPTLNEESCLKEFGVSKRKVELIKETFFKTIPEDQLEIFLHVCKHTGLDPFLKQIYPVMRKGQMTIQTGIDGYRLIAERTGRYSPGREATYLYNKEGGLVCATAYIKKMTQDGTWHEVSASAFFNEYNPGVGPFWQKMPHVMIAKCAEVLALRKAFPAEMSGLRSDEEMEQADAKKPIKPKSQDVTEAKCIIIEEEPKEKEDSPLSKDEFNEIQTLYESLPVDYKIFYMRKIKEALNYSKLEDITKEKFSFCKNRLDGLIHHMEQAHEKSALKV